MNDFNLIQEEIARQQRIYNKAQQKIEDAQVIVDKETELINNEIQKLISERNSLQTQQQSMAQNMFTADNSSSLRDLRKEEKTLEKLNEARQTLIDAGLNVEISNEELSEKFPSLVKAYEKDYGEDQKKDLNIDKLIEYGKARVSLLNSIKKTLSEFKDKIKKYIEITRDIYEKAKEIEKKEQQAKLLLKQKKNIENEEKKNMEYSKKMTELYNKLMENRNGTVHVADMELYADRVKDAVDEHCSNAELEELNTEGKVLNLKVSRNMNLEDMKRKMEQLNHAKKELNLLVIERDKEIDERIDQLNEESYIKSGIREYDKTDEGIRRRTLEELERKSERQATKSSFLDKTKPSVRKMIKIKEREERIKECHKKICDLKKDIITLHAVNNELEKKQLELIMQKANDISQRKINTDIVNTGLEDEKSSFLNIAKARLNDSGFDSKIVDSLSVKQAEAVNTAIHFGVPTELLNTVVDKHTHPENILSFTTNFITNSDMPVDYITDRKFDEMDEAKKWFPEKEAEIEKYYAGESHEKGQSLAEKVAGDIKEKIGWDEVIKDFQAEFEKNLTAAFDANEKASKEIEQQKKELEGYSTVAEQDSPQLLDHLSQKAQNEKILENVNSDSTYAGQKMNSYYMKIDVSSLSKESRKQINECIKNNTELAIEKFDGHYVHVATTKPLALDDLKFELVEKNIPFDKISIGAKNGNDIAESKVHLDTPEVSKTVSDVRTKTEDIYPEL